MQIPEWVSAFFWLREEDSICFFAFGENDCVAAIQLAASDSPPDCRIQMGSSPLLPHGEKKKAIPIGMTFSFLVAEAGLEPTTSGL